MTNRKWAAFRVSDIFNISTGSLAAKSIIKDGNFPRITARSTDNGIDSFTQLNTLFRTNENCVSISFLGSCFYQPYNASYDMKIHSVTIKNRPLNRHIGLFLANQFNREFKKFSYGNQLSSTDLARQHVLLPVAADGAPDWQFMEEFMRQKEQQILKPTLDKICKQLILRKIQYNKHILLNLKWKEYIFGKEFSITATRSGIDRNKLKAGKGENPYITRTDISNGIDSFVNEQGDYWKKDEGNVITIGLDTQTVFYQVSDFYTGQNIQVIRHPKLDKYNATFIIVAIKKLVERFSWGSYGATLGRLRKSKIFLPANENGEIDFSFMSAYMREVEYNILNTTLKYFFER